MSVQLIRKDEIGFIEFDQKDSKVNVLNSEIILRLNELIDEVKKDKTLKGLCFVSRKKDTFIAGADIKEIESITDPAEGAAKAKAGQDVFNKIEDLSIPTIAVIDGVALGGGCELALACRYRVATDNPKVKIGLPEIGLGFVPGFGGTYRLPRIVGLVGGLTMILSRKQLSARAALKMQLVDKIISTNDLERNLNIYISEMVGRLNHKGKYRRKRLSFLKKLAETSLFFQGFIFNKSNQNVLKETKGHYPAPLRAIKVIKESFYCDREKGLFLEREAFGELAVGAISKNLVRIFYLMQRYKKLEAPGKAKPAHVAKCSVLGAGVMGGGVAQLLSSRDILTRVKDINMEAIAHAYNEAAKIFGKAVKRRIFKPYQAHNKMGLISSTLDYSGFKSTDFVIEAVIENMDIKKKVFKELSDVTRDGVVLATNTSALSVTEMAKEVSDPSRVIGMHFFNPVYRMPLIEVITTPQTSDETLATTLALVKRLGKTPIIVKDSCGFIVNRILLGYINEGGRLLEETGEMEAIDKIMTDFGMPMGPFVLSDEVGIDVGYKVLDILDEGLDGHFKPVDIFAQIYQKGWLGRKSGIGFYIHKKKREVNRDVFGFLKNAHQKLDPQLAEMRMVYIMINEAAKILEEHITDGADTIDVGMIFGTGFPAFRGGLLRYADSVGIDKVITNLEILKEATGSERFKPAGYLLSLKEQGKGFLDS